MAETNAGDESETALGGSSGLPRQDEEGFSLSPEAGTSAAQENTSDDRQDVGKELHCPKCNFSTTVSEHLQIHILTHVIVAKKLACLMMSLQSKTEENCTTNLPLENELPQQATIANSHSSQATDFFSKESESTCQPSQSPCFVCPQCSHSCSSVAEYQLHTILHNAFGSQNITDRTNSTENHQFRANEMSWPKISNGDLCCPICRCYSVDENSFGVHLQTHVQNGRFWCDKCLFSSSKIEEMKIHLSSHCTRSHKRISCPHCDFTTANKSYFKVHLSTHTGEGKMYCTYCNYSTVYKSNFKQHVAAHEKKSELQCPMCDFKCVGKSEYGLHFASHTGEKRMSCPYCKFNTSNKTYFKQHVGSHTGAGKMHCPFCKFSTVNKSYYRIHLSKHTGEGTLRCSLCSFTTVYKNNFRRHLAKHQTEAEESAVSMNVMPPRRGRPSKSWKEMQANLNSDKFSGNFNVFAGVTSPAHVFRPPCTTAPSGSTGSDPLKFENQDLMNGHLDPLSIFASGRGWGDSAMAKLAPCNSGAQSRCGNELYDGSKDATDLSVQCSSQQWHVEPGE